MIQGLELAWVDAWRRGGPNFPVRRPVLRIGGLKSIGNAETMRTTKMQEMVAIGVRILSRCFPSPETRYVGTQRFPLAPEPTL